MENDSQNDKPLAPVFFRHRSPTFSKEEVKALLKIVEKYKSIICNKSTGAAASHAKEAAWVKVSRIFNRQGFKHVRSSDSLKIKWDNLKKLARKSSNNLMHLNTSEFDEVNRQMVSMLYEAENTSNFIEEPVESDMDVNESKIQKESTNEELWNDNGDKDSDASSIDGDGNKGRSSNRSINFRPEECNLLLQCVRQEKNIVFSKATTAGINSIKNRAWARITNSYNKLSPEKRTTKVLRTKFGNMKKLVKSDNIKNYFKEFGRKQDDSEDSGKKIKSEPLFEYRSSLDADNDDDIDDHIEQDEKSNSDVNTSLDPLSTVLNSNVGLSPISEFENKEVVKLKLELLNHKMEIAKLKRQRMEELLQADAADRETLAIERSLRLRAARLEAVAAEMKLPPAHPALAYPAREAPAQLYVHHYHAT